MSLYEHNKLTKEAIGLIGKGTRSVPELMVVTESIMLGVMLLLVQLHGKKPGDASIFMEAALQRATERFAEQKHGR